MGSASFDMRKDGSDTTIIAIHGAGHYTDELAYRVMTLYTMDPEQAKAALAMVEAGRYDAGVVEKAEKAKQEPEYRLVTDDEFSGMRLCDFADSDDYRRLSYMHQYAIDHQDYLKQHPADMAEFKKIYNAFLSRMPDIVAGLDEREFNKPDYDPEMYDIEKRNTRNAYENFLVWVSEFCKLSPAVWAPYSSVTPLIATANGDIKLLKAKALQIARMLADKAK